MIIEDIGAAWTADGLETIVSFSAYVSECELLQKKLSDGGFPIYILQSDEQGFYDADNNLNLTQISRGEAETIYPRLWVIHEDPRECIQAKIDWLIKVFKNSLGILGYQDEMPVDYQNIRFWIFNPVNGRINSNAQRIEKTPLFISSEELIIAAKILS